MHISLLCHRPTWGVLIAAAALTACSGESSETATQIAAKVNREEISVHQVNFFLGRQGPVRPDAVEQASRQTLEALVDQELAVQAAIDQRLDRDPLVLHALEAARREVLARAYADRLAHSVPGPTTQDVKQYYDSKPALFSRRKLYTLVDTALEATPEQEKTIAAQLPTTRGTADVAMLLERAGVRYGSRRTTVGAEALPLHAVDAMASLNEGQSMLVQGPRGARIYTVVEVAQAPLSLEEARPSIENFLLAERRREAVAERIQALRTAARIEYRGRFAQPASARTADTTAAAPAAASVSAGSGTALSAVALEAGLRSLSSSSSYSTK